LKIHGLEPTHDYCINGADVFDLYIYFIQNKREFILQKIGEKTLQGIMSKFIFSLFANKRIELELIKFSDVPKSEFGYQYISYWKDFYNVEFGMDDNKFEGNETQFL
jgi:CRISPR-associated endonuclease/helicase Cas3